MVLVVQVLPQNGNIFSPGRWNAVVAQLQFFRAVAHD